jgi:hypothetical protein
MPTGGLCCNLGREASSRTVIHLAFPSEHFYLSLKSKEIHLEDNFQQLQRPSSSITEEVREEGPINIISDKKSNDIRFWRSINKNQETSCLPFWAESLLILYFGTDVATVLSDLICHKNPYSIK